MKQQALGMIETRGLVPAIEAADAGTKAANVRLLGYEIVQGALVMVAFVGEVAAVQASVDAGTAAAQKVGTVISSHVIPRPEADLGMVFKGKRADQPKNPPPAPDHTGPGGGTPVQIVTDQPEAAEKTTTPSVPDAADAAQAAPADAADAAQAAPADSSVPVAQAALADVPPELAGMTVGALRHLARSVEGLGLHGREISRANKDQLIRAIMEAGA